MVGDRRTTFTMVAGALGVLWAVCLLTGLPADLERAEAELEGAIVRPGELSLLQMPLAPNFAAAKYRGTVSGPRNSSASADYPPVINDERLDGYAWAYLDTPLIIRFAEPQKINTIEVLLYHEQTHWYSFRVEVKPHDGSGWRELAPERRQVRGMQTVAFPPVKCQYVRLTFTDTSVVSRSYHVVEVGACLHTSKWQMPLRAAYEQHVAQRGRTGQEVLLHHLGEHAAMTAEELAAALAAPAGTRLTRDLDGDGDPDLADFVDTAPRHTVRPMVVRVLDDDDDMGADGLGDSDSDCYIADWRGDGSINRAVDYWDEDGDGDLDRQDLYYEPGAWHLGNHVEVVVIRDIGDDNRLWYTRNYEYQQRACQWQSDFNGDEMFCMFYYDRTAAKFLAWLEAPFTHHNLDGDGAAEMTVQFLGSGETMRSIRFSFDADNDSHQPGNPRDYDFSFNCRGQVPVPEEWSRTETLRNGEETGRYLDWPHARKLCETGAWKSCRLCWDEVDNNVNVVSRVERDHERWEGVGGYEMREGNKRWEIDADFSGGIKLYYWPVDRRLHLFGAESGYIEVDYDFDMRTDAVIRYADRDGDGFFDEWSFDTNADGTPERIIEQPGACEIVPIDYDEFAGRYRSWVQAALDENASAIADLKAQLGEGAHSRVEDWWLHERPASFYAADKLAASAEFSRYYSDLIREELRLRARRSE